MKKISVTLLACSTAWCALPAHSQTPSPSISPSPKEATGAVTPAPLITPVAGAKPSPPISPQPSVSPQDADEQPRVGKRLKSLARKYHPPVTEPMDSSGAQPAQSPEDSSRIIRTQKPERLRKKSWPDAEQKTSPTPNDHRLEKKPNQTPMKSPTPTPAPSAVSE
jgi:hypothetical protein